ncbi:MAG: ribosomal RNA small subunit methyltransferase A [Candidatus Diapherotrites archaeon]|nr:ribosomal RNA small subunit methyltransferase A [Candidatus Diapherotrites archaeon]
MSLFIELTELMAKYRFRPRKKLAQNFLTDEKVIQRMVTAAELNEKDKVLEIGAGTGFLTRKLQKHCSVIAIEYDETLCELLQNELAKDNLELICGDFLKVELPDFNKIVSTPPYHISKKIMIKLLKHGFELAVLAFQEEFVEKLTALPGFPQYGALSVLTQYKTNPKVIGKIEPKAFFPKPKSRSRIVKLEKNERKNKAVNELLFFRFVEELFRHRNKNLSNAISCSREFLSKKLGIGTKQGIEILHSFELEKKVALIEVEEFIQMFNALYECSESA